MFADNVDDVVIWNLSQLPGLLPECAAFLKAEGARRIQHKKALLFLQDPYSSNVWQREVMHHKDLSRMILTLAFEHTPFRFALEAVEPVALPVEEAESDEESELDEEAESDETPGGD